MKKLLLPLVLIIGFIGLAISCSTDDLTDFWDSIIPETDDHHTQTQINTYVFKPAVVDATDERVQQLRVPSGFAIQKFAEDLGESRILAADNAGHVYVTNREGGEVILLEDTNGDGAADRREVVSTIEEAHGLAIYNNRLYIVTIQEIFAATINGDGTLGEPELLTSSLPDGGQHPNRTIGFGPDGMMYVSVGSTCNACIEPNELHATMLQANPDASGLRIYAEGLRNTIGFGWHPDTDMFWGMDHGIDMLGDDESHEELNHIVDGANYGWPHIYDEGKYNAFPRPEDMTYQEYSAMSTFPELMYTAHSAPMQMVFYSGDQFPSNYNGDAFVAFRGSWNRSTPSGYKVSRIVFENGQPARFEDFLTGFLVDDNNAHFGRLVGLAVHSDGSLLVSDDTNGVIYRVSHP
ncbi:PQQ-dependent sugar dehydrogenase [Litoribacter populi]|uniref:PQQ-dependent sugar dehydrogenase n=1 Tax=Litoribacter populi TaxID=2598460 RepID=UPI00117EF784|nr:PQQ-dependent sugar dehydrogenase [Litoribacter populi]